MTAREGAAPGQAARRGKPIDYEPEIPVRLVQLWLCDLCLDGEGDECHTPGCSLWIHDVPKPAIRNSQGVTILGNATEPIAAAATAQPAPITAVHAAELLREARYSLSSLLDRCEGHNVLTDDEDGEYRQLVGALTFQLTQPEPAAAPGPAALARVLSWFAAGGTRREASATRAQLAHAYADGGLTVPEELRRFL